MDFQPEGEKEYARIHGLQRFSAKEEKRKREEEKIKQALLLKLSNFKKNKIHSTSPLQAMAASQAAEYKPLSLREPRDRRDRCYSHAW